jgi:hypothetical protein
MDQFVQPALQPYVRLAQSNFALWSEFWASPTWGWPQYGNFQRWFASEATPARQSAQPTEAWNRLLKGLLENYTRFATDVFNSNLSFWNAASPKAGAVSAAPGATVGHD